MAILKRWFACHGIPRILYTDNGPQYASREFANFSKQWSFDHVTSSPHFPRSNGLSERFVQTAKTILKKCSEDDSDIQLALLLSRNTPRDNELASSSHRLMGRRLRTPLPITQKSLKPELVGNTTDALAAKRIKQKEYADKGGREATEFTEMQQVMVQNPKSKTWEEGEINKKLEPPRSYLVKLADGQIVRRNARDLKNNRWSSCSNQASNDDTIIYMDTVPVQRSSEDVRDIPTSIDQHERFNGSHVGGDFETCTRSGRVIRPRRDDDFEYY